jgi:hypothetical protein
VGYTFDGGNKLVILTTGTVAFDVDDMYSRWIDWLAGDPIRRGFLPAMRSVGGDAISATKNLGVTFFMVNGWRVRPDESNHTLRVNGNLYTDPSGFSPFVPTLGAYNVMIEMTVSSIINTIATSGNSYSLLEIGEAVRNELTPELDSITAMQSKVDIATAILRNKTITDPTSGVMTVYADDGVTPLYTAQMYENTAQTQTYRGQGAEVRNRLT